MSGRTGRITVRYNTTRLGGFHKTIVVRSNAANQSTAILFIKGFVKKRKVRVISGSQTKTTHLFLAYGSLMGFCALPTLLLLHF